MVIHHERGKIMVQSGITIPNQQSIDVLQESIESLHETVSDFVKISNKQTRAMLWLTGTIAILTLALVAGLSVQIVLAFVLI